MFSPARSRAAAAPDKRVGVAALTLTLALALAIPRPVSAATPIAPSATASFSGGAVAAGAGYTFGSGVLHYRGRSYPFKVAGLSVNDIGIDHIEGVGEVYNLKRPEDFSGNYVAAGAGATVAGGGMVAALENASGVIIHFHSTTQGLRLSLSANGVYIHVDNQALADAAGR